MIRWGGRDRLNLTQTCTRRVHIFCSMSVTREAWDAVGPAWMETREVRAPFLHSASSRQEKQAPLKAATAPSSSPLLPNVDAQITRFLRRTQVPGFCVEPADFPWPVHTGPAFMGGGKLQQVTPIWARGAHTWQEARGCSRACELPEKGEGKIGNPA